MTVRQKVAIQKVVETGGRSVSAAMREAGYPATTAKNPSKLTESKAWAELMDEFLPDDNLLKVHQEGLAATKKEPRIVDRDSRGAPVYDYIEEPDYVARKQYLSEAYKIKNKFAPTNQVVIQNDGEMGISFVSNASSAAPGSDRGSE